MKKFFFTILLVFLWTSLVYAGPMIIGGASSAVTSSMIVDGTIVNDDISATAAIAQSKLSLDSTLTDIADGTIDENLVNTANPWADNEISDTLTIGAGSTVGAVDSSSMTGYPTGAQPLDADLTSLAGGITGLALGAGDGGGYSAAVDGTDFLAPSRIDDTKGNGDTGYVWSADKSYDTFALAPTLAGTNAFTGQNTIGDGGDSIKILYDASPGTDTTYDGEVEANQTAGENLVWGDIVYFNADKKWWKIDADAEATAGNVDLGFVVETINADATGSILRRGFVRDDSFALNAVGDPYYLSTTSGGWTNTAPSGTDDIIRRVGTVRDITTDTMKFDPAQSYLVHD